MIKRSGMYVFDLIPFSFGCVCLSDVKCLVFCLRIMKDSFGHYAFSSMVDWSVWIQTCLTKYLTPEFTISLLKDAGNHQKLEELTFKPVLSLSSLYPKEKNRI